MPSDVRFAVVRKLLEQHGWRLKRVTGSHHIFDRPGGPVISIPVHRGQVRFVYVKDVEKIIARYGR
jgi:predicted RNA binding protein YcfA (HicA-like mRNA interferase family)